MLGRLRRRFRLRPTFEGWFFLAFTLAVGFAALNTGNNLLYLVFGMLLGLIVASGVLSNLTLRGLEVRRSPPPRVFARQTFLMGIGVRNVKRSAASFSIEVEDFVEGRRLHKRCFFLKVPAGRSQQTSYRHQFVRRGGYRLTGFRVATRFPFALFRKWRDARVETEVVVYPEIVAVAPRDVPETAWQGEDPSRRRARRGEFAGLRPFQRGDDERQIHWRASAHAGRLMVLEHEAEQQRTVVVTLDNAAPPDATRDARDDPVFERAVSRAASLVMDYGARGFSVGLAARDLAVPPGMGDAHLGRILRELALVGYAPPGAALGRPPRAAARVLVTRAGVEGAA